MKLPSRYLLTTCLAALSLTGCNYEAAQQTPALSQEKGRFDEKDALTEADLLLATAARQTGVSIVSVRNARTAVRFSPEDNVFFPSALAINFNAPQPTVTLPVYKGIGPSGNPTYYIITEAASFYVAKLLGVNFAPKLVFGRDTEGSQDVTLENGLIKFKGDVDFSPERVLQAGPDPMAFPPSVARPGAIGDAQYSPVVVMPSGSVLSASIVANRTGTHDHLVSIDYDKGTVVMELLDGFQGGAQFFYHLVTESSDRGAATIERGIYTPRLANLPEFGRSFPTDESALLGFAPLANGETGFSSPNRQGLNSTILDGNLADPINVFPIDPDNKKQFNNNYSPMWDAHIYAWTPAAIQAGKRTRVRSLEQLTQLVKEGSVTDIADNTGQPNGYVAGLKPTRVIINCPVMAQPANPPANL
ncbi:MAG: hypothetical protein H7Z72_16945 [Bacteroidetes bacterium]|nr:hypothetical protein [Fibrella sp.]